MRWASSKPLSVPPGAVGLQAPAIDSVSLFGGLAIRAERPDFYHKSHEYENSCHLSICDIRDGKAVEE
jgi:hypothetical protein